MKLKILTFTQPIGDFALSVMSANNILKMSKIDRREFDINTLDSKGGPQRDVSISRINDIASYSETPDATFPTPILLALPTDSYSINDESSEIEIDDQIKASVVDGQHRILGLQKSKYPDQFILPVVFILDATEEQKALIFAIINGKQTRVSASIIYDLFSVVEGRNPFKTAHEIARSLNSNIDSPFFRRLKMLGKKTKGSAETLSQGTFVKQLLPHISNQPEEDFNRARKNIPMLPRRGSVFNKYFLQGKDEVIVRILLNLFSAVQEVFPDEWSDPAYILAKTTGYTGIMNALPEIISSGEKGKDLSKKFFSRIFQNLSRHLIEENLRLINTDFSPGGGGEAKLRDLIKDSI